MRTIKSYTDVPLNTMFYREVYDQKGKDGYVSWTRLYDKDLNVIEDVHLGGTFSFRNALGYRRICTEHQAKNDIAMSAYTLRPVEIDDGYYEVIERTDTIKALEQITRALRRTNK